MSTTETTKNVVKNYLNFFPQAGKNPLGLKPLLSDELHFQSPLGEFFSADSFMYDLQRNALDIRGLEIRQIMAEGNKVCALYDVHSYNPSIGTLIFSEWFTIENGKIASIRSTYDTAGVRKTLSEI